MNHGASIYITKRSKVNKYIFGGKIIPYEMKYMHSIDIDKREDLLIAKVFKEVMENNK